MSKLDVKKGDYVRVFIHTDMGYVKRGWYITKVVNIAHDDRLDSRWSYNSIYALGIGFNDDGERPCDATRITAVLKEKDALCQISRMVKVESKYNTVYWKEG